MSSDNKYLFPVTSNINNLQIDDVGKYSISKPDDANVITRLIKKELYNNKITKNIIITDATAGVGGNTISFCDNFFKVNAIEINKIRFNYLKNNLIVYDYHNFDLFNTDMLSKIFELKQDIIFIDPPWGGKGYTKHKNLNLFINDKEISEISKEILDKNICSFLVLKLPYNYKLDKLSILNKYYITNYLIRKKILLVIIYNSSIK